ncbi:MAG: collagen-like protein [Bacteroidales bacterium]|nr:collagen-like protein [Bacteroidales bacterium]
MRKSLFLFALPMLALALLIGCEGDEGPAGPKGDKGDQGDQGTQGVQGETGTANVIYSDWITPLEGSWRDTTIMGSPLKINHLNVPLLTQAILDQGVIICYSKSPDGKNIMNLPYDINSGAVAVTVNFRPFLQRIIFYNAKQDGTGGLAMSDDLSWRYVLIPGGVPATKSTVDLASLSYEEVCEMFDIPE